MGLAAFTVVVVLAAGPLVSAEFPVDAVVPSPAPGDPSLPVAAFDGTNFLTVWEEGKGSGALKAARVSATGTVLDPAGFFIAAGTKPSVAFGAGEYLVAYEAPDAGPMAIHAAHVSTAGAVLEAGGFTVSSDATRALATPAVAYGGTGFSWPSSASSPPTRFTLRSSGCRCRRSAPWVAAAVAARRAAAPASVSLAPLQLAHLRVNVDLARGVRRFPRASIPADVKDLLKRDDDHPYDEHHQEEDEDRIRHDMPLTFG